MLMLFSVFRVFFSFSFLKALLGIVTTSFNDMITFVYFVLVQF